MSNICSPKVQKLGSVLLLVLWAAFIWGNSLQSAEVSGAASGAVTGFFRQWVPWLTDHIIRKTAHFIEYAVLGGLLSLVLAAFGEGKRRRFPLALYIGLVVPLLDETIQLFVPGRSGKITDVLLDHAGVLTGLAVGSAGLSLLSCLFSRRRRQGASF